MPSADRGIKPRAMASLRSLLKREKSRTDDTTVIRFYSELTSEGAIDDQVELFADPFMNSNFHQDCDWQKEEDELNQYPFDEAEGLRLEPTFDDNVPSVFEPSFANCTISKTAETDSQHGKVRETPPGANVPNEIKIKSRNNENVVKEEEHEKPIQASRQAVQTAVEKNHHVNETPITKPSDSNNNNVEEKKDHTKAPFIKLGKKTKRYQQKEAGRRVHHQNKPDAERKAVSKDAVTDSDPVAAVDCIAKADDGSSFEAFWPSWFGNQDDIEAFSSPARTRSFTTKITVSSSNTKETSFPDSTTNSLLDITFLETSATQMQQGMTNILSDTEAALEWFFHGDVCTVNDDETKTPGKGHVNFEESNKDRCVKANTIDDRDSSTLPLADKKTLDIGENGYLISMKQGDLVADEKTSNEEMKRGDFTNKEMRGENTTATDSSDSVTSGSLLTLLGFFALTSSPSSPQPETTDIAEIQRIFQEDQVVTCRSGFSFQDWMRPLLATETMDTTKPNQDTDLTVEIVKTTKSARWYAFSLPTSGVSTKKAPSFDDFGKYPMLDREMQWLEKLTRSFDSLPGFCSDDSCGSCSPSDTSSDSSVSSCEAVHPDDGFYLNKLDENASLRMF